MGIEERLDRKIQREHRYHSNINETLLKQREIRDNKDTSLALLHLHNTSAHLKTALEVLTHYEKSSEGKINAEMLPEATDENIEALLAELTRYYINRVAKAKEHPTGEFDCPRFLKSNISITDLGQMIAQLRSSYWLYLLGQHTGVSEETPEAYVPPQYEDKITLLHESVYACFLAQHPDIDEVVKGTQYEDYECGTDLKVRLKDTFLSKNRQTEDALDIRVDVTSDTSIKGTKKARFQEKSSRDIAKGKQVMPQVVLEYHTDIMPLVTAAILQGIATDIGEPIDSDHLYPSAKKLKIYLQTFLKKILQNKYLDAQEIINDLNKRIFEAFAGYARKPKDFNQDATLALIDRMIANAGQ